VPLQAMASKAPVPVEANLAKALADLRLYDLAVDLHGSRAVGIAQRKSNVDVLITRPLESLLQELEQDEDHHFKYIRTDPCLAPWWQPPRLVVQHLPTGVRLDLISRWSADIFVRERDAVARVCLQKDDRVQAYLEMALKWYYARRTFMPADQGYPTAYCFRLIALHYLMSRQLGVVLPPLTRFGSFLNEDSEDFTHLVKDKVTLADDLAVEFLEHLGKVGKHGEALWADLRKPSETGPLGVWQVIDPPSHKKLLKLKASQIVQIGKMAKMDAKALRYNKGALEKIAPATSLKSPSEPS